MGRVLLTGHVLKPKSTVVSQKSRVLDRFQRHISHDEWPMRWLWIEERDADIWMSYAEKPGGTALKKIRMQDVVAVHPVDSRTALKEGVPQVGLIDHCFAVLTNEKRLVFASLDGKKDEWVAALQSHSTNGSCDGTTDSDDDDTTETDATYDFDRNIADLSSDEETEEEEEEFMEYLEEQEEDEEGSYFDDDDGHATEPLTPSTPASIGFSDAASTPSIFVDISTLNAAQRVVGGSKTIHFAAKVVKRSSKDKDQNRLLIVTDCALHIIETGRFKTYTTKIPVQQVTGIIRNIHDDLQLAVLWCSGHDYLFTFTDGGISAVGAFVAHLSRQHQGQQNGGTFMVRDSLNILTAIRRSESDSYEPLESGKHDSLHAAREPDVFPTLRMNGDAKVCFSGIVIKETSTGDCSEKLLVVTDLALYFFQRKDFSRLTRRIGFKDIRSLMCYEPQGYILIQTSNSSRRQAIGDVLFRPALHTRGTPDGPFRVCLDLLGASGGVRLDRSHHINVTHARSKATLFLEGKLAARDTISKIHSGARRMKKVKELKDLQKVRKKMQNITQKLGGGLFHISEGVVDGVAGMYRRVEGSMGAVYEMAGHSAGQGLHRDTVRAADAVGIGLDKLTGPRGNAVFTPLSAATLSDLGKPDLGHDTREPDTGHVTHHVANSMRFADEADIPQREVVWFACNVSDLLEQHQHYVLVVTSHYVLFYTDPTRGSGKPSFSRKHRIYHRHVQHLRLLVDCATAPEQFLLGFKDKDFLLSCRHRSLDLLKRYILRRHTKLKKRHPVLLLGSAESLDHLRILQRAGGNGMLPQQALVTHCDTAHLGVCELAIATLGDYGERVLYFSGVVEAQLFVRHTEDGRRSFDTRKYLVAVTEAALYLLCGPDSLTIKRRVDLPLVAGLLLYEGRNDEVLLQTLCYRVTVKQVGAERRRVVGDQEAVAIVEEAFQVPGCVDIMARTGDHVVFRLWPVNATSVMRVRKRWGRAAAESLPALFHGSRVALTEDLEHDDLLLRFEAHAEDFANQLHRARAHWTCYEQPGVPQDELCQLSLSIESPPGKSQGHALSGFARVPSRPETLALPAPDAVRAMRDRWISRRVQSALDSEAADRLCYELQKGTALGLVTQQEARELQRVTRGRMASATAFAQRVLNQLTTYIADERFSEFDKLSARMANVLTPDVTPYYNKAFRSTSEWTRKPDGPIVVSYVDGWELESARMTIDVAKTWCQQHDECVGFTHNGCPDTKGEVSISFRTSKLDLVAFRKARQMARRLSLITPGSPGLSRSPAASAGASFRQQPVNRIPTHPTHTVYTGLHPCQDALVNVLDSTTWLLGTSQLAVLQKRKQDALEQRKDLAEVENKIPNMMQARPRPMDVADLEIAIRKAQLQTRDYATNENSRNAVDMLQTIQLVLTACMQRENIRRNIMELSDPVAARLRHLSWHTLCRDENGIDESPLDYLQYTGSSMWNAQITLELEACRDPDHQVLCNLEHWLFQLDCDFADATQEIHMVDSDELLEAAVKHRWLAGLPPEEDVMVSEALQDTAPLVMQRIIWQKRVADCVCAGDADALDEVAEEGGPDIAADVLEGRHELARLEERAGVAARVSNWLAAASRAFSGVSQATEQELACVVLGLEEVLPQARTFTSLASEAMCLEFLHKHLLAHQYSKKQARERVELEARRHAEAEEADKQRSELLQQRIDQKETEKLQRAEMAADKVLAQATRLKDIYDDTSTAYHGSPDISSCTRRRNDCLAVLSDARSLNQAHPHAKLQEAIATLETLADDWAELMVGKEEQERKALGREVTAVIESKDRATYYHFVKCHRDTLPLEELMRLRLGWAAVQATLAERAEAANRMAEAVQYRDKFELNKAIDAAVSASISDTDPLLCTARDLLAELQGGGSPREEDREAHCRTHSCSSSSATDSEEEDAASLCPYRVTGFNTSSMLSDVMSPSDTASPLHQDSEGNMSMLSPVGVSQALPPPPGCEVLQALHGALQGLKGSSDADVSGLLRCQRSNPWVKTYVDAWCAALRFKLKKKGRFLKKADRHELDVFTEVCGEEGDVMKNFDLARRINHATAGRETFLVEYLLQSGRFHTALTALLNAPLVLPKLYDKHSVFIKQAEREFLIQHLLGACKHMRFDFRLTLSDDDASFLKSLDSAPSPEVTPAAPSLEYTTSETLGLTAESMLLEAAEGAASDCAAKVSEMRDRRRRRESGRTASTSGGNSDALEWAAGPSPADGVADPSSPVPGSNPDPGGPEPGFDVVALVMQTAEFDQLCEIGKLKAAVGQLLAYYAASRRALKISKGPKLRQIFDEGKNPALGVLARERLCPALIALLNSGFKANVRFKKRHVWQYIEVVTAMKRKLAQDLGSVKLPEAVDTVHNVVDMRASRSGPSQSTPSNDAKLRAFLCFALNKGHLKLYLETLYDLSGSPESRSLHRDWYQQDAQMLDSATRSEVDGVIDALDGLTFHLHLHA